MAHYDQIGINYSDLRKPDPRIAAVIEAALGSARSIVNVGAGTGSYEPAGRRITAVEPSREMRDQRPVSRPAQQIDAIAEDLPFENGSFDAAMAVLTVHHWTDQARGLSELRRVARGPVVILTFDAAAPAFWLADYIPELVTLDKGQMPPVTSYADVLGDVRVDPVEIPHDCEDGFLAAYWRRPSAYLDPRARKAISSFWTLGDISKQLAHLGADLKNGAWAERYGELLKRETLDCGYRLVSTR